MVTHSESYDRKKKTFNKQNIYDSEYVILGDSRYTRLNANLHNSINLSLPGETSFTMIRRIKNYEFKDSINIILGIGLNDLLFSYQTSKILKNLGKLINVICGKTKFSTIFICKIFPINSSGFFYSNKYINQEINTINLFLDTVEINENKNLKRIIEFKELEDKNNILNLRYSKDGIHLNPTGLLIFKGRILKSIKNEQ